jgi:hypothetical protein
VRTGDTIQATEIELRLLGFAILLVMCGAAATWAIFDLSRGLSFLAGGVLGGLSLAWLRKGLVLIFLEDQKTSRRRILAGFLLRLLLIPLFLYAMIRFLFVSVPAVVAGFAVIHFSVLVEGILEAFSHSPKRHARAK